MLFVFLRSVTLAFMDLQWHWTGVFAHYLFLVAGCVATVTDFWRQKIYNWLTLPTLLLGLVLNTYQFGGWGFLSALLGFLLAGVVYLVLGLLGAMKGGDLKLAAAMGACLGWPLTVSALFYGFIAGGFLSLIWAAFHGTLTPTLVRVGRSAYARLVPGMEARHELAESSSPPMPYGVAIATGGVLAAWYLPELLNLGLLGGNGG